MYIGTIKLDRDPVAPTLADDLRGLAGVAQVSVMPDGVSFISKSFGELKRNDPLKVFAGGRIRFDALHQRARCWLDVRWRVLLITTAVFLAIALIAVIRPGGRSGNLRSGLVILAFFWFWLVLGNLFSGVIEFRSVLRRALAPSGPQRR